MRADEVYAILKGKLVKLTEDIKSMGDWEPIQHKGTVQTADDLPADAKEGWMYNIATDSVYGAAGMNVVMTSKGWDPMGPIINMNLYLTKEEGTKSFQPKGNYLSGTDTDLKESGKAADAKVTGEKIAKNSSDIAKKLDKNQGSENSGKIAGINEVGDIVPMFPMGVEYNSETNCLEFGSDQKMELNQGIGLDSTLTKTGSAADAGATGKEINSLKEDLYELSYDIDELIFNQKYFYRFLRWEQGEYISASGIKTDSSDDNYLKRVRSDLIKCDSGISVTFICDTNYIYNIHIWDNNKKFVKSSGLISNAKSFSYKIDGDYFSLSVRRSDYAYITPKSMSNSVIQAYSYKNFKAIINETDLSQSLKDSLLTKTTTVRNTNILSFGDSVAKGIGNRINDIATSYARIIAQKYNVENKLYDYSVGGKCMSGKWKDGVVNQVETAVNQHKNDDFSLIFLEGGINDITANITVGEVGTSYNASDFDDTTFCGALEKSIYLITKTWTKSKLIFIMPHHMAALDQTKQKEQHDKVIEICTKWGVPIADVYAAGGMNTCIEEMAVYYCNYKSGEPFNRDTAHPNNIGYKKCYVPLIEKMI